MIDYRLGSDIDMIRLIEMFAEAGWEDKTKDFNRLVSMVESSDLVVTAWDFDYMVGFAQMTCDGAFNGHIYNVVVDSEYCGKGIEGELIKRILNHNSEITYFIKPDNKYVEYYESLGFEPANCLIFRSKE
jgi:ribosomal protein S18 acetylase RimI-like enzyme